MLIWREAGAYPGSAVGAGAACMFSPYNIANVRINAYDVVNNKPSSAAYRAPGAPNAAYASESVIDELAEKLGLDPLELRQKNASHEGSRRADGTVFKEIGCIETLEAAMNSDHYRSPVPGGPQGEGGRLRLLVQRRRSVRRHPERQSQRHGQPD